MTSSAFPIFLLHMAVCIFFAAVFRVAGIKDQVLGSFALYLVRVMLTIAICIGVTWLLCRLCPRVAGVMFGGR